MYHLLSLVSAESSTLTYETKHLETSATTIGEYHGHSKAMATVIRRVPLVRRYSPSEVSLI